MKAIIVLFAAACITGGKTFAHSSPAIDNNKQTYLINESPGDTIVVPVAIKTSFATKYPNASKVTWYRYTPVTVVEPDAWYSSMDASDYYVTFLWDDAEYIAWYDNGTWIRSSQRIDNTDLPDVVSRVISSQYPGYVITDVDLERDKGQQLYEVDLVKGIDKWNLHISPTGAVIKKKQRTISKTDPQTAMVTDFQTRYPNVSDVVWYTYSPRERVEILPSDWDYNMDATDYEVHFLSDGTEYVAYYDNGQWLRAESYLIDQSKLPSSVSQAINKEFTGYTIKDVDREDNATQVLYEVELQKGTDKCKIHYATDGSVVKKKCRIAGVKTKDKATSSR